MSTGTATAPDSLTCPPSAPMWHAYLGDFITDNQEEEPGRSKRSRVALACQRCKTRKQKCDGAQPCSKCNSNNQKCEYIIPQRPMPFGKKQYIKALERRVAELETILATHGMAEPSRDHWSMVAGVPDGSSASTSLRTDSVLSENKSGHESPEMDDDEPEDAVLDWKDGVDSVVSVLRSLSLDVNGSGYVGASSHVALGRLFSFLGRRDQTLVQRRRSHHHSFDTMKAPSPTTADTEEPILLSEVSDNLAERLFGGYLKHIATRWPIVHSVWVRQIQERRHNLDDLFETTMLHLVYATAGRFIETTGETGPFQAKRHYASAIQALDTVLAFNDIRTVQALMLMAVYCLRDPVGAGAWTCSRMALIIAIDHGLHRQTTALSRLTLDNELRKRLFWSCYAFDRQISIPLGRPFGISDRDIDIELPLDIDENTTSEQLKSLASSVRKSSVGRSTSLSSFLFIVRLRQIESDIQQTIYRVDKTTAIEDSVIDSFLTRLEEWKESIPQDTRRVKDAGDIPFDGYDFYLVFYYKCQRLLLYPQISKSTVTPRFLKECAKSCAGVCGTYKRLHQSLAVGYSLMALQTVFMAGLTLVYCLWISPDDIFDMTTSNGIHDCSIVLFVIAERVQSAKKYRNAFETIRQRVIDQLSQASERRPREAVAGLSAELAQSAQSIQIDMPFEVDNGSFDEFSRIITDMTGEDFVIEADFCPTDTNSGTSAFPSCNDLNPDNFHAAAPSEFEDSQPFVFPMETAWGNSSGPMA